MDFYNRNNNFVIEITILPLFHKLEFLGSYTSVAAYIFNLRLVAFIDNVNIQLCFHR